MATGRKNKIADETKLADLTVGELKALIREIVTDVVESAVFELEQELPDPDAGKELKAEVAEQLRQSLQEEGELYSAEDIIKELGLDE